MPDKTAQAGAVAGTADGTPPPEALVAAECRGLFALPALDLDRSFAEMGANSFSLLQLLARISRASGVRLTSADVAEAKTPRALAALIAATAPEAPAARFDGADEAGHPLPVPMTANRFSYFLRRERDLHCWWVVSGALESDSPLDEDALRAAAQDLVWHHPGLRLRLRKRGRVWEQVQVPASRVNPFARIDYRGPGDEANLAAFIRGRIERILRRPSLDRDLFKVLLVRTSGGREFVIVLAHHVLADAFAYRIVMQDLFTCYAARASGSRPPLPPATTGYRDYACAHIAYWLGRALADLKYWEGLPWAELGRLPIADPERAWKRNVERETRIVVPSIEVGDPLEYLKRLGIDEQRFTTAMLAAIGAALGDWTGHRRHQVATVFHGRESFAPGIDLTRTVGWLSDTVPLLLPGNGPLPARLAEVEEQLREARRRGSGYGVLRHLAEPELRAPLDSNPRPEISLNLVPPALQGGEAPPSFRPWMGRDLIPAWTERTKRVFLLSGGVYFRDSELCVSWDFNDRILQTDEVERFAAACLRHFEEAAQCLRS